MNDMLSELLEARLHIMLDMNLDGALTISDVLLWLRWLFWLPGDLAALALLGTPVGDFFEVAPSSMQGIGSALLSLCVWLVVAEGLFGGQMLSVTRTHRA
jgi:hypothetical protein